MSTERRGRDPVLLRLVSNFKGLAGTVIVGTIAVTALAAPLLAPYAPNELGFDQLQPPSAAHPFGTDELGRDILSRIFFGARISVAASLLSVLIAGAVGTVAGMSAGCYRGRLDSVLMRFFDTMLAFPAIFLAIAIVAVAGPGFLTATLAVAAINLPGVARLMRAATLAEASKDYVEAARALGASDGRILLRSLFPNCTPPLIVQLALVAPAAVLAEASLSFLGLGTQPPDPSWGAMLQSAQGFLGRSWTYSIFPGAAISLLAVGMNYLGDSMQDALDPRRIG